MSDVRTQVYQLNPLSSPRRCAHRTLRPPPYTWTTSSSLTRSGSELQRLSSWGPLSPLPLPWRVGIARGGDQMIPVLPFAFVELIVKNEEIASTLLLSGCYAGRQEGTNRVMLHVMLPVETPERQST
jgi:hypothetical protein